MRWTQPREYHTIGIDVFRIELTTSARVLWKTRAARPVGVEASRPTVLITPDARSYYSYARRLGDLFVVDGLK